MVKNDGNGNGNGKARRIAFHKMFSFADKRDIVLMIVGTLGAIGNGLSMPLLAMIFGNLTDAFGQNQSNSDVVHSVSQVALQFVYLAVATAVLAFLQVSCWMVTGERQASRIRGLYLKTILRQDISFFDLQTNTGEVIGRMSGDTVLIQDAMGEKVGKFLQLIATFIGGFVIAFIKGWLLTLVMLTTIPLIIIIGSIISLMVARMTTRGQTAYAKAATVVEQTIGSIRIVASFTGEKHAIESYKKHLVTSYKSGTSEGLATGFGLGALTFVNYCGYSLAIWFGGKMILEKGYTGGEVINVLVAVLTGSMSLGQASPCLTAFAAGQAAAYKMFETINRKPEIDAYDSSGEVLEDVRGEIELRNVYFSYPARPDEQIFSGFSLSIESGTTAALVGQSGSGKSTVISLVERFYDPQAGEVLIDGINLKQFQLKWIRGKIGLVSQEPALFTSSIKDNIGYGKEGATIDEIRAATELANAAKFIDKLPQGLDTMVGEHGTQLSGGQKQRIAIARAILKNPRILLLDEATSALDAESEKVVQEALDRIMVSRTTVIVAHRLSTIKNADTIVVIHRGKMVEKGSHSELLKDPEGAYSQLIRLQEINKWSGNEDQEGSSNSRKSFSVSFGIPTGNNITGNVVEDASDEASPPTVKDAPNVSIKRLAYLNKPEIPMLFVGTIAAIGNGVTFPIFGILISRAMKSFYEPPHELSRDSKFWALMFSTIGLASLLVYPTQTYLFSIAGCRLIQRIRSICFEKVVGMEVSWFDEPGNSSGAIGARLSADAATVRVLVGDKLAQIVQNIGSIVAGLVIAFSASWQLALIILGLVPLIGLNGYLQLEFMTGFSADAKVLFALTTTAFAVSQSSSFGPDSSKAKTAVASIFSIIDRRSKIDPSEESGTTLATVKGDIELIHISFCYPCRPDVQIFKDLSLAIHSGQSVAIVGESGSGKSTVIALLQRFYDPDTGRITLDQVEIQSLKIKWLRQQMGLVSQEPALFNDTIRANIAYGKQGDATENEILSASGLANAHKFISGLQQGYDTIVGERGVQLSGGQKQRIAIARAIVKDPKILLLDEATSALDAESEKVVQDALERVSLNRTTVVVAHRLSSIKNADVIAVLKNGVIAEKGRHESLMNIKHGVYASLVALHTTAAS
ncbi:ABC transporter B family member 21 [Linum perenne]